MSKGRSADLLGSDAVLLDSSQGPSARDETGTLTHLRTQEMVGEFLNMAAGPQDCAFGLSQIAHSICFTDAINSWAICTLSC